MVKTSIFKPSSYGTKKKQVCFVLDKKWTKRRVVREEKQRVTEKLKKEREAEKKREVETGMYGYDTADGFVVPHNLAECEECGEECFLHPRLFGLCCQKCYEYERKCDECERVFADKFDLYGHEHDVQLCSNCFAHFEE